MSEDGMVVAVVGATGAVGSEMLAVLEERAFPVRRLVPLSSARSAGSRVNFREDDYVVTELTEDSFEGVDIALFSAGASVSEKYAPCAVRAGAVVVDNTSYFRMQPDVPLVVPEVNPEALAGHRGIIANPNCSTIQTVVALKPLHDLARLERVICSTYQSASGAGRLAMDELREQTVALLNFRDPPVARHPRRLAFDCLPQIDRFLDDGSTKEEWKMIVEHRKILGEPELRIGVTCVRVPVFVGHAVAVHAEFARAITPDEAAEALEAAPGIIVRRRPDAYPTAADAAGKDEVFVGRIRRDESCAHGVSFWVVADNLRKGAATNAVQVAECLIERDLLGVSR